MHIQYPLQIKFKVISFAEQSSVTNADGSELLYVKQKMFKLKEKIDIYRDHSKTDLLYTLQADRVLDFSPEYMLRDAAGQPLAAIKRHGAKSMWRASYDISVGGQAIAHVREQNPWTKVADSFLSEIPLLGVLAGFLFHPVYVVESVTESGKTLARIKKEPAFFEGKFTVSDEGLSALDETAQASVVPLLMAVVLLERNSG